MHSVLPPRPRHALYGALAAGALLGGSFTTITASHAAAGCRADPIVVLSNGVVLDLSATLDADVTQVQQVQYALHVPHGVSVVRAISTDGVVGYKENFASHDDSKVSPASPTPVYRVEVTVKAAGGTHTGWATIEGGYADQLGITPDMVGLTAFTFNPTTPAGTPPPPPPPGLGANTLPATVTAALATWAQSAAWTTSSSSASGATDHPLVAAVSL